MKFSDVIGQIELKNHLTEEVRNDKISHAQLFLGKPGYGGLPLALAFVQYMFCENRTNIDSCGECAPCRKVGSLQHPDLHFSFPSVQAISKTSDGLLNEWREQLIERPYFDLNDWIKKIDIKERKPIIGKDESQAIIKKLNLRSYEGGYKIMIVWMAEEMNPSCANKLLKILEEPPAKTLFILLASSHEQMLQTILSRTQIVNVPRIDIDHISSYLIKEKSCGNAIAESIAARVDGDLVEACELVGDHIEQDDNREMFVQLMRVCYSKKVIEMMEWSEAIASTSKEYQKGFIKYALHMFRQSMLRNYTEDLLTKVSEEEDGFLEKFSKFITGNNIVLFTKSFDDAYYHIDRNANAKILFTNLCFQVMRYIHVA